MLEKPMGVIITPGRDVFKETGGQSRAIAYERHEWWVQIEIGFAIGIDVEIDAVGVDFDPDTDIDLDREGYQPSVIAYMRLPGRPIDNTEQAGDVAQPSLGLAVAQK